MEYCTIDGCEKPIHMNNLCSNHYRKELRKRGSVVPRTNSTTHGMAYTSEYSSWMSMKCRCTNKNYKDYDRYGGRGIKLSERWMKFSNFIEDMGPKPNKDYSIERIDVDGDYELSNCRWATRHEQAMNRRKSTGHTGVTFMNNGHKKSWRARLNVNRKVVLQKYFNTFEEAVKARKNAEQEWNILGE